MLSHHVFGECSGLKMCLPSLVKVFFTWIKYGVFQKKYVSFITHITVTELEMLVC